METKIEIIVIISGAFISVDIFPNGTFIPKNDDIIVGIDNTIVTPARNFITLFRLLDTMVAYVSAIDDKISLYIPLISIACLFSIIASSNKSLSPSYSGNIAPFDSFSRTKSFAFNDVIKYTNVFSINQIFIFC